MTDLLISKLEEDVKTQKTPRPPCLQCMFALETIANKTEEIPKIHYVNRSKCREVLYEILLLITKKIKSKN